MNWDQTHERLVEIKREIHALHELPKDKGKTVPEVEARLKPLRRECVELHNRRIALLTQNRYS